MRIGWFFLQIPILFTSPSPHLEVRLCKIVENHGHSCLVLKDIQVVWIRHSVHYPLCLWKVLPKKVFIPAQKIVLCGVQPISTYVTTTAVVYNKQKNRLFPALLQSDSYLHITECSKKSVLDSTKKWHLSNFLISCTFVKHFTWKMFRMGQIMKG